MTRLSLVALLLLALTLLGAPRAARAAESYDNCTGFIASLPAVITTQGTWCLSKDLNTALAGIYAIDIQTNNVTIDCNDFKLGGQAAGLATQSVGIHAQNRLNATVRHCNIRGFLEGVYFAGSGGGHVIEDSRFDGNTLAGVWVEGDGSVVRRNQVYNSGRSSVPGDAFQFFQYGIHAVYSVDILDNTVSGVTAANGSNTNILGIHTANNDSGSISGNRVRGLVADGGGTAAGIWNSISGRVTVRNNDVNDENSIGGVGLHCTDTSGRATGNVSSGFATGIAGCSDDGGNVVAP